jgi:hypothetical protein
MSWFKKKKIEPNPEPEISDDISVLDLFQELAKRSIKRKNAEANTSLTREVIIKGFRAALIFAIEEGGFSTYDFALINKDKANIEPAYWDDFRSVFISVCSKLDIKAERSSEYIRLDKKSFETYLSSISDNQFDVEAKVREMFRLDNNPYR